MELTISDIEKVWFEGDSVHLRTKDGQEKSMPISWFPRLNDASDAERDNFEMRTWGLHWPHLNEDLSYNGFFTYNKDEIIDNRTEVQVLLARFPVINISKLAVTVGISPTLMRHYACGVKVPSAKRLQKIKEALHKLGRELLSA